VLGIFATDVLDAKVVDDKGKNDWAGGVFEEAGGVSALVVAMGGKIWNKGIVCNFPACGRPYMPF
jgi:hypothetical protein